MSSATDPLNGRAKVQSSRSRALRRTVTTRLQDLQYGTRMLRKRPGFTLVAVFPLALAIGAKMAIYSVMHAALFDSYSTKKPDELLRLDGGHRDRNLAQLNVKLPDIAAAREQQTSFKAEAGANNSSLPFWIAKNRQTLRCE